MQRRLETAILFLIFDRPKLAERVFNAIRKAAPVKLFIAADAPRKDNIEQVQRCRQTRKIVKKVDWDCEVKTLFREDNLGCRKAVSSAIDWFFDNVEEGIILEDDILPADSFFWFCQELLRYYREQKGDRLLLIKGE